VELQEDHRHLREVSNPRLADTPFRSPQLTLLDISPDAWVLYWPTPSYAPRRRSRVHGVEQLFLFDLPSLEKAVGADAAGEEGRPRTFLRLLSPPTDSPEYEEP
jgi:hypothetical protein